jgi:hypothetical protein
MILRMLEGLQEDELELARGVQLDPQDFREKVLVGTALRGLEQIRGAADAWASLHAGVYPERVEQLAGFEAGDRTWLAAGQPIDPWNNAYVVQFPTAKSEGRYLSLGSDRKPGGEGLAADIELP